MIITVAEIVRALRQQKQTCVVTLTLERDNRLFKVFVRNGEICALALGALRDAECFAKLGNLQFKHYTFIPESGERMPAGRLDPSIAFERMSECGNTVCGGTDNVFGSTVHIEPVDPLVLADIEEAVTGMAGPVAGLILDECLGNMGARRGAKLSPGALRRLTNLLAEELPVNDRPGFLSRFSAEHA
jgi:hypothetical protein